MLGDWATSDGGAVALYDPASDSWADPSGESSVWYAFGANGRYSHARVEAGFGFYPCSLITMTYETGTLAGSGAQLILQPQTVRATLSACVTRATSRTQPSPLRARSVGPGRSPPTARHSA